MLETPIKPESLWPPPYTIRHSQRALRTFIQIKPVQGLEIVVPIKQKHLDVEELLYQKRCWIEKILSRMQQQYCHAEQTRTERPNTLECRALSRAWHILYQPLPHTKRIVVAASSADNTLWLKGNTESLALCYQTLLKWLMQEARRTLPRWLETLSISTGLMYNQTNVRGQTTLWGSCNAKKNISLNYKLLFLPKPLAEHVLIHELCHTKYLNHSSHFWRLLQTIDPNFIENKRALKTAERYLPYWLACV